ncbi:uncharacterized protein [Nicotiana sylvestris]|uniref:uncharacterized protein n=1 Tax=Nicotiana sylvestris TaxID=4096 RepID=UPI00388C57F4
MRGLGGQVSVAYKDLCLFPDVQLPVGFKMPKFDLYDGHGDPVTQLRGFCSKMRGEDERDELLMAYFSQSLSGSALEWYTRQDHNRWYTWDDLAQAFTCHFQYNLEIIPDRLSLTKIEKKPGESFREYGFRWREQAVRVDPPMKESEMVDYFLQALEPTYFGHLVSAVGKSFNEIVNMGGMVKEGLKLRQLGILSPIEPKLPNPPPRNLDHSVSCEYYSSAPGHDAEKCWQLKTAIQEFIDTNRIEVQAPNMPNINQNSLLAHQETNMIEIVHKEGESKKPSQTVMMIRSSDARPFERSTSEKFAIKSNGANSEPSVVVKKGSSSDVAGKNERAKVVVPGVANKLVVIVEGARINPVIIKPVTQLPIVNRRAVPWNYERVTVTYKGKEVKEEVCETNGLTRSGRCFVPEELRIAKSAKDNTVLVKKAVTEEEAEEFLRKMKIANKIFEVNKVSFSEDELPMEGTEHNRALYLTVKCEDSAVTRVLVDNSSSANICPLSTLNKLKVDDERIHKNSICIRGFDDGGKDSVGDIVLKLTIGPVEFTMEFQVLDMAVSYNLLEIILHDEDNWCVPSDTIIPFIEFEDDKGPWVYQFFDMVSVEKIIEGKPGTRKWPMSTVPSLVVDVDRDLIEKFERLFADVNMLEAGECSSKADVQHIPRIHNEVIDALATLASMLHHPDKAYMNPLQIQIHNQHAYCNVVEEELDGEP